MTQDSHVAFSVEDVSPKIRDFLGYEPEEALGKTPFAFMPPEEASRVVAIFGPLIEARVPFKDLENRNLHKDGRTVVLETSAGAGRR